MKYLNQLIKINTSNFKIFQSPVIQKNWKVHNPNFTQEEKKQLRAIFRLLLNEYLLEHFKWHPEQEVREAIAKIPQRIFIDRRLKLETYVGKYYLPLMKKSDRFQHLVQQTDLRTLPDKTVSELLQLEVPINQHPVFHGQNGDVEEVPGPQPIPNPDVVIDETAPEDEVVVDNPDGRPGVEVTPHKGDKLYKVKGIVSDTNGVVYEDLVVKVYDRDLRSEQFIGETRTDRKGLYCVEYHPRQVIRGDKKYADLAVKVFTQDGKKPLFHPKIDDVRFNARPFERINISIREMPKPTKSEFQRNSEVTAAVRGDISWSGLQETGEVRDITFISRECGISRQHLEYMVLAHQLADNYKIQPDFFYAVFRKDTLAKREMGGLLNVRFSININSRLEPLFYDIVLLNEKVIRKDIDLAVKDKIVPARVKQVISEILNELKQYKEIALLYVKEEKPEKIKKALSSLVEKDTFNKIDNLINKERVDFKELSSAIKDVKTLALNDEKREKIEASFLITDFLGFDEGVLEAVKKEKKIEKPEDVQQLVHWDEVAWERVLANTNKEKKNKARPNPKVLRLHAKRLVRKLESKYPSEAYKKHLSNEKNVSRLDKQVSELIAKYKDFNFKTTRPDVFFKKNKIKNERVKNELKKHQRLFKLTSNYKSVKGLREQKINSAQAIVATGKSRFLNEVAPKAGLGKREAETVYQKAQTKHTAALMLAGELQDLKLVTEIPALAKGNFKNKLKDVKGDFPNLKSLFQLTDTCECQHCRSVYSPAAYLVELLQFLDKRGILDTTNASYAGSAKDALFGNRRGDLGDLDLSCSNANTAVPYIDLVCEILEEHIAPNEGMEYEGEIKEGIPNEPLKDFLSKEGFDISDAANIFPPDVNGAYILRDENLVLKLEEFDKNQWLIKELRQTYGTAEELSAAPYYVNQGAYNILKDAPFSFDLPFDLSHTEALAYFDRFGLERWKLMQHFHRGNEAEEVVAAEKLGLTEVESNLIFVPVPSKQSLFWNSTDPAKEFQNVENMLNRTGLTYLQLSDVLQLNFIHKGRELFIKHNDDTCNTATKEILGLNDDILDRIHRFLRLWKKLGWKFQTLDEVIMQENIGAESLVKGDNRSSTLLSIYRLQLISERTGIDVDELVGCFGHIPHTTSNDKEYIPLYQSVFLNKVNNGVIEDALRPENISNSSRVALADHSDAIASALQLSSADFDILITTFGLVDLTWTNLSKLYAWSVFAHNLKIPVGELMVLYQLNANKDPFVDPVDTLAFIDVVNDTAKSPISISDVEGLLAHKADKHDMLLINNTRITEILGLMQMAFQEAYIAHASPFDEELTVEELLAPLKTKLLYLPSITEDTANNFVLMAQGIWTPPDTTATAANIIDEALNTHFDTSTIKSAQSLTGEGKDDENKSFIETILAAVCDYLYQVDKETIITNTLVGLFGQEENLISTIWKNYDLVYSDSGVKSLYEIFIHKELIDTEEVGNLPTIDENNSEYADHYGAFKLLHKLIPLWSSFELNVEEVAWWIENANELGLFSLDALNYEDGHSSISYSKWLSWVNFIDLSKKYYAVENPSDIESPITFQSILEYAIKGDSGDLDTVFNNLSLLTGYDVVTLKALGDHLPWNNPSKLKQISAWSTMEECMTFLQKMNISVEQAVSVSSKTLSSTKTSQLRTALKSKYSSTIWPTTLKEIMDAIRPQKRDALVSYILTSDNEFDTVNDLFDYFLIDTEMESCMPSSRIVQAHGVIQLFVQRCLMGLEPKTSADVEHDNGWEQWKWMRNYRVWEANRKVFLYPENWIEPELLDDKSFLFQNLENELLQNELNVSSTENAIIKYVEAMEEISFLEVMTAYYEVETYTTHVFARTKNVDPAHYFYRRFEKERYWTPWERIDLEIEGDSLVAFKQNGRLYVAWPQVTEETDPDPELMMPAVASTEQPLPDGNKMKKRLSFKLCLSQFSKGVWKPKKISKQSLTTSTKGEKYVEEYVDGKPPFGGTQRNPILNRTNYSLFYNPLSEEVILVYTPYADYSTSSYLKKHERIGKFLIAGCQGNPEVSATLTIEFPNFLPDVAFSDFDVGRFERGNLERSFRAFQDHLDIYNVFSSFGPYLRRFTNAPEKFKITTLLQPNFLDVLANLYFASVSNEVNSPHYVGQNPLNLGTLFPFFFTDTDYSYSIVPGFYGEIKDESGNAIKVKRTYSDLHKLLVDSFDVIRKYVAQIPANPAPSDFQILAEEFRNDPDTTAIKTELEIYSELKYSEAFKINYYPLLCYLRKILFNDGVKGVMNRNVQLKETAFNFQNHYLPDPMIVDDYPKEDIDFSSDGSYSGYNWELFYHTPLMIANRLRQDQRFEEALDWYHYMFNPTGTLSGTSPQKYWVTKPFYQYTSDDYVKQRIDTLLYSIADTSTPEIKELEFAIEQWREKPFRPHTVARFRPVAYQKCLLMNYIQNLIDWGDYQFRIDTMESITQATQLYILADKLLGAKPRMVPPVVKPPYQTYNQIESDLDAFGNALVDLENLIPDLDTLPNKGEELPAEVTLASLYFCIPPNEKMLGYWDLVEDRLFKIRHCQNIDGVERALALFAPPIDPGALVKAAAAGLSISSVIAGMNAPLPHYRFNVLSQKATELTQEVRTLGNALLQVLEKKDAEELALLRSGLENKMLKQLREVKQIQIDEAVEQLEVLNRTKLVTEEKVSYYEHLFENEISAKEQLQMDKLGESREHQKEMMTMQNLGAVLSLSPNFSTGGHGAGGSPSFSLSFGGSNLAQFANFGVNFTNNKSMKASYEANLASIEGGYERRAQEWEFQKALADKELHQINQQLIVAEITKERFEKELENHDIQIENNEKADEFMRGKYTNQQLYQWMIGEISGTYFQAYQMAYDMAKKAEKCYQHELGNRDSYIEFGYWDSLKKGLLASDGLIQDIKRMEVGYLDKNAREYEITKNVSLAMLDPLALLKLKETGSCNFEIPEVTYDMDHPGHYFRRIKSVSITIPCIVGPYNSVSGKLSMISNRYRKNTAKSQNTDDEYGEEVGNDTRFTYNVGAIQSVATSNAQSDSGLFELNFRDERYLPFEGKGAIGSWRFEMPSEIRQFDFGTINDLILNIRYTAREGGSSLRTLAEDSLASKLAQIKQELSKQGLHRAISIRHELPNEWHSLKNSGVFEMVIDKNRLPYFAQTLVDGIEEVSFIADVDHLDPNNPRSDLDFQINDTPSRSMNLNEILGGLLIGDTNEIVDGQNQVVNDQVVHLTQLDMAFSMSIPEYALLNDLYLVIKYNLKESSDSD